MVVSSIQEDLSSSIMESLSCGTSVVGFDFGGNSGLIDHKRNGCLAKAFDLVDLARGIEWVLACSDAHGLRRAPRKKYWMNLIVILQQKNI